MRAFARLNRSSAVFLACAGAGMAAALAACGGAARDLAPNDLAAASITLAPVGSATVASGMSLDITASVHTKDGAPVTGAVVSWTSSDATVAKVADGTVTGAKVGTAVISATAGAATGSITVTVTGGAPASLVIVTQPLGSQIGGPLHQQPVLAIHDAAGNVAAPAAASASIVITASIASGAGTLSGSTTINGSSSAASFQNLCISGAPGSYTLSFSAPGLPTVTSAAFTMNASTIVNYGTPSQKVAVVDIGNATAPSTSITDGLGNPLAGATLSFASRATSIATVDAGGRITAHAAGETWVVAASSLGASDSVFVIVPRSASSPVLRTDATTWVENAGDTLLVHVVLDTRGTTVGAASLSVGVQAVPQVWTSVGYTIPLGPPAPIVSNSTSDVLRVAVGSANGMTGVVPLLTLKLVGVTPGASGWLTLLALDVSGVDGTDITPTITSTRLPLVIR